MSASSGFSEIISMCVSRARAMARILRSIARLVVPFSILAYWYIFTPDRLPTIRHESPLASLIAFNLWGLSFLSLLTKALGVGRPAKSKLVVDLLKLICRGNRFSVPLAEGLQRLLAQNAPQHPAILTVCIV